MDDTARRDLKCPEMSLEGLISASADRNPKILAEEQRADTAMRYNRNGLLWKILKDLVHGSRDSGLCVDSTLPSSHTLLRPCKEGICHRLELGRWKKPSCAPVILMQPGVNGDW
jgi:hypothetical protein